MPDPVDEVCRYVHFSRAISERFVAEELVHTDAVLSLDEDVTLIADELDFVYQVSGK